MIPIQVEGGFQADASGNGTDQRVITSGHWCAVKAFCQCPGTGNWAMGKTGYVEFAQQSTANAAMGYAILRPGDQIEVSVTGAAPNAEAQINYFAWQGDAQDGSDLVQFGIAPMTAGSISGAAVLSIGGQVAVSLADSGPAAYQSPLNFRPIEGAPIGNPTVIVPAPTAPYFIRVFKFLPIIQPNTLFGELQGTDGSSTIVLAAWVGGQTAVYDLTGAALPVGYNLQFTINAANTTAAGYISWSETSM